MGITPGTSKYLQFLSVAKLILDPADPVNFAGHLTANTLPNLLASVPPGTSPPPQDAKKVLTQAALCDQTVPNTWNYVLDAVAGTGPMPLIDASFGAPGTFQLYFQTVGGPPTLQQVSAEIAHCGVPGNTSPNAVKHGFLANWGSAATQLAQTDAANFVVSDTLPMSLVFVP
jgi:hypothetical protein